MNTGGFATLVIVGITVAISLIAFNNRALLERLILWPPAIDRHKQYERLVTYGLIHADGMHLLFNMLVLFSFGAYIERFMAARIGWAGYTLFYVSALVASILPTYLQHRHDAKYRSLGASGAVSAVMFAFILMQPWAELRLYFAIPIPAIVFAVAYVAYSVWRDYHGGDNVNHSAHLWGAAYGVMIMLLLEPALFGRFVHQLTNP
jgi:membrane associated rhomboid family serine protease